MIKREHADKRVYFIERNERGRWTLRGGLTKAMMREDPSIRQMDIGLEFVRKQELLCHLDSMGFTGDGDSVIIDGIHIIRW